MKHTPSPAFALAVILAVVAGTGPSRAQYAKWRGLVVFARFDADTAATGAGTRAAREWNDPRLLPRFAGHLLSPSPSPPFEDSSLTAYYHAQSLGRFTLYGDAYPAVVTLGDESSYTLEDGSRLSRSAITGDILSVLGRDRALDLRDYDADRDGHLDHLFVIVHRSSRVLCEYGAGIADLGEPSASGRDASQSGVIVDRGSFYRYDSPGIIIPNKDLVRLMAHEVGHHLWDDDTPLDGAHPEPALINVPTNGSERVGYTLMAGGRMIDTRGDLLVSPGEREMLGWISCEPLSGSRSVFLGDLYSSGDCARMSVPTGRIRPHALYLVNRQRIGYFDRLTRNGYAGSDHGLMTTGLLVQVVQGRMMSIIPADGDLVASVDSRDYDGDLFGPDVRTQLTPWTRPNINGSYEYFGGRVLEADGFQAIDDVRYAGKVGLGLEFEYVADFRKSPTFREDSWIGDESAHQRILGLSSIAAGAVLTISAPVEFSGTLVVRSGSTLVIEPGGEVRVTGRMAANSGGRVIVRGVLDVAGTADLHPGSVRLEAGGDLRGQAVALARDRSPGVVEHVTISGFPNPFRAEAIVETTLEERILVTVIDQAGREVDRLSGYGRVVWRPGGRVAGGTYLIRVEAGRLVATRTLTLVR